MWVEETRMLDECDIIEFSRLFIERIKELISRLGDRLWPQTDKQDW